MKKNILRRCALALALSCMSMLAGCGSAPAVSNSQVVGARVEKIHAVQLWYRVAQLKTTSSSSWGSGPPVVAADVGLAGFGPRVVQQAAPIFLKRGVQVSEARVIEAEERATLNLPGQGAAGDQAVLSISVASGKVQATSRHTTASYVFSAVLFHPASRRVIWRANIDASTWVGTDIVLRNVQKTTLDDAYAAQLLNAVAEQMQQDGVI